MIVHSRASLWCVTALLVALAACGDDKEAAQQVPDDGNNAPDMGMDIDEPPQDLQEDPGQEGDAPDPPEDVEPEVEDEPQEPPFAWDEAPVVPMALVDGLPLIDVTIDAQGPFPFVVDTLSQTIFVDVDIVGDDLFHQAEVSLGEDKDLGELIVKGRDMDPDEANLGVDIGGLVGQRYLDNRFTLLDYPGRQVRLLDRTPPEDVSPPPGHEDQPLHTFFYELPNLFPVVVPTVGADTEVPLLADTSSRMTFISQRAFDAIDDGTLPQIGGYRFLSNFGEAAAFLTRLPEFRFGELVVRDLVVGVVPDDNHLVAVLEPNGVSVEGFLGANFWNRFAVGVDGFRIPGMGQSEGGTKLFFVWGDGTPLEEQLASWVRVGVELARRDGGVIIEMVFEGSDAAAQGLVQGAVIESIDGQAAAELTLEEVRQRLTGQVGESRTLMVTLPEAEGPTEVVVQVEAVF